MEMDELAAALAHEVKNPVSLIKANIDYIQSLFPQTVKKNFSIINRELKRLDKIISDYALLYEADNEGELIFIADLLSEIAEEYENTPLGKSIKFTIDGDENLSVRGDYHKLYILFFNIIKNAVEAIEKQGLVACRCSRRSDSCIIEIYNNGGNIPEEILKKLGTPYVTTKVGGSGLGIVICRSILEEYGGSLIIENIGNGCRVTAILPSAE